MECTVDYCTRSTHNDLEAVSAMLAENGFEVIDSGTKNLRYIRAEPAI